MKKKFTILFLLFGIVFYPFSLVWAKFPNDPYFKEQKYLSFVQARQAWKWAAGHKVVIAELDSGVDLNQPDLKNSIWTNPGEIAGNGKDDDHDGYIDDVHGWNFVDNNNDPEPHPSSDCFQEGTCSLIGVDHGTILAGVMAAQGNNHKGIIGLAYGAKIMPLKVLDDKGRGNARDIIEAINYAIRKHADIINLSLVGSYHSPALDKAIARAWRKGIIVVAASGNNNSLQHGFDLDKSPLYPVCEPVGKNYVLGVAAVNYQGQKSKFSNYGKRCIDLSAPGNSYFSTLFYRPTSSAFSEKYGGWWSGTSVAAALVSAAAALVKSVNRHLSNREVVNILEESSTKFSHLKPAYQGKMGEGILNAGAAVKLAVKTVDHYHKISYAKKYLVVAAQRNSLPYLKLFNLTDNFYVRQFLAYPPFFHGGVNVATGDVNGDGLDEIVVGAGVGGGPQVRVFNQLNQVQAQFFAYNKHFRGGVNVAVGDVNGDGVDEIITGAGKGEPPYVKVFDEDGNLIFKFLAYNKNFRGGVNVAVGDVNGDGVDEIITGAGRGGGPQVRIFDRFGRLQGQFFAYNKHFRGGVNVAVGDVNGDGVDEIITGAGKGGGPQVRIFDRFGYPETQFFAFSPQARQGVKVAVGDINQDGKAEIATAQEGGKSNSVRIFNNQGKIVKVVPVFGADFTEGINLAIMNIGFKY